MTFWPGELRRYPSFQWLFPDGCSDSSSLAKFIFCASVSIIHCFLSREIAKWRALQEQYSLRLFLYLFIMSILVANKGKRIIVHQTTKIQSKTEYSMLLMQTLLSRFYRIHISMSHVAQNLKTVSCLLRKMTSILLSIINVLLCFYIRLFLYSISIRMWNRNRLDVSCHHWMLLYIPIMAVILFCWILVQQQTRYNV